MSLHTITQKYLNITKHSIAPVQHLYEPKPISYFYNYILSLNSHFRILKEPTSTIRHPEFKMQGFLPFTNSKQLVTALESEYLDNST
jgi:hypothetical protein